MKNREEKLKKLENREWYLLNSLLGHKDMLFYLLLGGRERGKSYAVTNCYVNQFIRYGRPFYWLRLSAESARKLLVNNAEKLIDPDLRRKYKLELWTHGDAVYSRIIAAVITLPETLVFCNFCISAATISVKPNSDVNKKRSFINVPTLNSKLEVMEKVMMKNRMPNEMGFFFFKVMIANTMSAIIIREIRMTRGFAKLVISIW